MASSVQTNRGRAYISGRVLVKTPKGFAFERRDIYTRGGLIENGICRGDYESVDCSGKILFPAFFNMHVHLGENMFRNLSGDEWTIRDYLDYTNSVQEKMSEREREKMWERSANEVIKSLDDNFTVGFCAGRAVCSLPVRNHAIMSAYPLMEGKKLGRFIQSGVDGFLAYRQQNSAAHSRVGIILHSVYMNSETTLRLAKECLDHGAAFLVVHVAEDKVTASLEQERYGMSGIRVLEEYGLLTQKTILVHCGCASSEDLELVSSSGAAIAVCPISNRFLNTMPPDITVLDQRGIPWFLCTDGVATGLSLSMFDQAAELKKLHPALRYSELYESITLRPAKIYNDSFYTGELGAMAVARFLTSDDPYVTPEEFLEAVFLRKTNCEFVL